MVEWPAGKLPEVARGCAGRGRLGCGLAIGFHPGRRFRGPGPGWRRGADRRQADSVGVDEDDPPNRGAL